MLSIHKRRFCYLYPTTGNGGETLADMEKKKIDHLPETPPAIERQS